jgi:hypothetical protein
MDILCWQPGTRLDIREAHGVLRVAAADNGVFRMTPQGHLRLPSAVRNAVRLNVGGSCSPPTPRPANWRSTRRR